MAKCKYCKREFGSAQAVSAHLGYCKKKPSKEKPKVLESQPQENPEAVVEDASPEVAASQDDVVTKPEAPGPNESDTGKLERIRNLLAQGYTVEELIAPPFQFPESSVYSQVPKVFPPKGKPATEQENHAGGLPVVVKGSEVITPEGIMARLVDGSNDWERRLEGMMLLRAAQRMNRDDIEMVRMQAEADAARIKPILELMKETRLDQDAAAQRAKESNIEIAERAAYDTASQLSQVINQNNTRIGDSINQIRQAIGGKEEKSPLGQLLTTMQEMNQLMQMFGMRMPGQQPQQGGDQAQQPPPIVRRSRQKEGGADVRPDAEDVSEMD